MYCRFSSPLATLFIYHPHPSWLSIHFSCAVQLMLERPLPLHRRYSAVSVRSVQVKRLKLVHDESADEFERGEAAGGGGGKYVT